MSSFQRSVKHTKALIQAFQRPTQVRCFKAPQALVERGQVISRDPRCLLVTPKHRWSATMSLIPRALSQVQGFEFVPTGAFSFSSAATPQVDGKDSSSAPSSESTATASEEAVEPVQPAGTVEQVGGNQQTADEDFDKRTEKSKIKQPTAGEDVNKSDKQTADDDVNKSYQQTADEDVNKEDVLSLLGEKLALLEEKNAEIKTLKDKVLWSLAEMENVRQRTQRDADSTRKFAIQTFAKGLLDVADNLSRATEAVPEGVAKLKPEDDQSGNLKVLQSLLQGVQMTEKQLLQVFKKHGLERYESLGQLFDPNRHSAVFEMVDSTKPAGTISMELKAGYILNDRVIRPAEVAVVKEEE